ncbi:MAG TPA: FecR domain-containing protein [Chitinivibrionales bacterium]|nr:FecR domain-containing protein [Chitinivibrionales bacterium]
MKLNRLIALVVVSAFLHNAVAAQKIDPAQETFKHTVKKGETVSLVCIDYYGYWGADLAKAVLKDNPSLKDLNVIHPGDALVLHNPDYKSEKPAAPASQVFERRVQAMQGVVTYVEGDAVLIAKGGKARQKLVPNTIVFPGDVVQTLATGRVEMIINKETVVRLKENTRASIDAFRDTGSTAGETKMGFNLGSVWTKMKQFRDKLSRFELELPTAIAGVHGTVYEATVDKDSSSEVKVYNGEVAVKNNPSMKAASGGEPGEVSGPSEVPGPSEVSLEQWVSIVRDMQKIRIDKKGKPKAVEPFKKDEADSWVKWNMERDKRAAEMFGENEE